MSEENKCPKVGRPTKYTEDMAQKLIDFFNRDVFSGSKVNALPLFEDFAWEHGVAINTLYSWRNISEEFMRAYELCRQKQKAMLIKGGMLGAYKENYCKFVSTNLTDLREKTESEVTQKTIQINIDKDDAEL